VGFRVADEVARRLGATNWKSKDEALQAHAPSARAMLVKPLSYMNESGRPIAKIASWWKAAPADVLVIGDDLDLPFGRLRMRASGGSGGHNGLKSIIEYLGEDFPRLRIGIGRGRSDTIDHVLSSFTPEAEHELPVLIAVAADGVMLWLERGLTEAVQFVNSWRLPDVTVAPQDPTRAS